MVGSTGSNRRVRKVSAQPQADVAKANQEAEATLSAAPQEELDENIERPIPARSVQRRPVAPEPTYARARSAPRPRPYPPRPYSYEDGVIQRGPVNRYVASGIALALALALIVLIFLLVSSRQSPPVASVPNVLPGNNVASVTDTPVPAGIVVDLTATPVNLFAQTAGPGGVNRGQLNLPRGIALDAAGDFYVVDTQNLRVQEFDKTGKFINMFGTKGLGEGQFNSYSDTGVGTGPGGVAVDKDGNVYVADTWNHRMQKFSSDGKVLTVWGGVINLAEAPAGADPENNSRFYGPRGVAIGPDGNIYVTDTGNKRVLIFDPSGKFVRKIDSGVTPAKAQANYPFNKPGELNEPIGIAVDKAGNVYVADTRNLRIQKFGPDGAPLSQWPVPTGAWKPGPYLEPFMALDSAGNLYTTAPTTASVIKFDPKGQLLGQKKTEGKITLQTPTGIAIAPDDTIYVVDTSANAVVNFGKMP
jgi:sugar lactone lactonase YvrE